MKLGEYWAYESDSLRVCFQNTLINLWPDFWIVNRFVRPAMARLCGMACGPGVILQKHIFYGNVRHIRIGAKSAICRGVFLDGYDSITIGANVAIAFNSIFSTSNHEIGGPGRRVGKLFGKPIIVRDGVWIGAGVIVGPGTEIGAGSILSSGVIAMQSVPPNSLVAAPRCMPIPLPNGALALHPAPSPRRVATAPLMPEDAVAIPSSPGRPESVPAVVQPHTVETDRGGVMTIEKFQTELEALLTCTPGSLRSHVQLADLPQWDSMALLSFITMADVKLHVVVAVDKVQACKTVGDLIALFPGKIAASALASNASTDVPPVTARKEPAPVVSPPPAAAFAQAGAMPADMFLAELESLLTCAPGSLRRDSKLADQPQWDSMALLAFIAMADVKLHVVVAVDKVQACKTVGDLVALFPGMIGD